jgi:sugar transferase EpsL
MNQKQVQFRAVGYRGKRAFDIVLSMVLLLVLSPVIAVVGFFVRARLGSPVIFRQQRPGINGQVFMILKFRTMLERTNSVGASLPDKERLTPFGRVLRSSSLDELPELWNVLRGDMSLVGPRPLLVEYLPLYSPRQRQRHEIRPGITGWAQVNGRNALSWAQKFELDVWYVENASLLLDLRILAMTIAQVFRRKDIAAQDHVTMPEFKGNSRQ